MNMPLNAHSLRQIRDIIDLIEKTNDPSAECDLHIDGGYASISVKSKKLPINAVRLICGAAPLEADEVSDITTLSEAVERRFIEGK